jgi:hypothetical protein
VFPSLPTSNFSIIAVLVVALVVVLVVAALAAEERATA